MDSESYLRDVFGRYGRIVSIELKEDKSEFEVYHILFGDDKNTVDACEMDISDRPRIMYMYIVPRHESGLCLSVEIKKRKRTFFGQTIGSLYHFFGHYGSIEKIDPLNDDEDFRVVFERSSDANHAFEKLKGTKHSYVIGDKKYTVTTLKYDMNHNPLAIYFKCEYMPVVLSESTELKNSPALITAFIKKIINSNEFTNDQKAIILTYLFQ